jgi:hypothetical protein
LRPSMPREQTFSYSSFELRISSQAMPLEILLILEKLFVEN